MTDDYLDRLGQPYLVGTNRFWNRLQPTSLRTSALHYEVDAPRKYRKVPPPRSPKPTAERIADELGTIKTRLRRRKRTIIKTLQRAEDRQVNEYQEQEAQRIAKADQAVREAARDPHLVAQALQRHHERLQAMGINPEGETI